MISRYDRHRRRLYGRRYADKLLSADIYYLFSLTWQPLRSSPWSAPRLSLPAPGLARCRSPDLRDHIPTVGMAPAIFPISMGRGIDLCVDTISPSAGCGHAALTRHRGACYLALKVYRSAEYIGQ